MPSAIMTRMKADLARFEAEQKRILAKIEALRKVIAIYLAETEDYGSTLGQVGNLKDKPSEKKEEKA